MNFQDAWFAQTPAKLVLPDNTTVDIKTESLNPNGGTFLAPASAGSRLALLEQVKVVTSQQHATLSVTGVVTHFEPQSAEGVRIVVLFLSLDSHSTQASAEPAALAAPTEQAPSAWAEHPWFFNYRVYFTVKGFCSDGVQVEHPKTIRGLFDSLRLPLQLVLPGVGVFSVPVKVVHSQVGEGPISSALLLFESESNALKESISRYLLLHSPETRPADLERIAYPFPNLEFVSVMGFARTASEIDEVLALRLKAYSGKPGSSLSAKTDPQVMADALDRHSVILTISVGKTLVGTTRLVFNDGDRTKSEIAEKVELPDWLWKGGFLELSRSATLEEMRGRDVFANLRRHALRIAFQ